MDSPQFCRRLVTKYTLYSDDEFHALLVCIACFVVLCSIPLCRACVYVVVTFSRLYRVLCTSAATGGLDVNESSEQDEEIVTCTAEEVQAAWKDFYADLSNEELHNLECFSPR
jgi:hypothetical protein